MGGSRLWSVRASVDPSEPGEPPVAAVELAVARNLSCSERAGLGSRNQTFRTRWNCLVRAFPAAPGSGLSRAPAPSRPRVTSVPCAQVSRQINGREAVSGPLTINGVRAAPLPPHAPRAPQEPTAAMDGSQQPV